jgi:small-conductance mechanosensitive channel
VNSLVLVRGGTVTVRILLSPLAPALRIIPVKDQEAAYLAVWIRRFLALGIYGFFAIELLASLGLPDSSVALLQRLVGLCLTLLGFMVIMQSRETVARWIREHPETGGARKLRQRLADIWHVFAMLAVAALFAAWALNVDEGFETLLRGFGTTAIALFGALAASAMVHRALLKLFDIGDEYSDRFPGLERRSSRYLTVLVVALNVVIWGFATALVMESWGLDALDFLMSPGGLSVVGRLASIALMIVIAIIIWEMGDGMISAYLNQQEDLAVSPRMKTLLPLMRNVLLVVISTIAVITILSEIGVETGPLLAGAGVVGLAVGFGAQTLVKDVITGAFIMFEDQFSVGDWIEAGGKMGGVESITIRTVKLRDFDGYVHTVPFGEITALTNMMRDFGYAIIDVGVAYQENTDRVIEVIREVDTEARRDEAFAEGLVGDLEVMGVNDLGDSAVTVWVGIKTLAGYQWGVRREYLRQIKLKFDEVGIEIPFPHMTVYFGEIRGGNTSPAHVRIDAEDTLIEAEAVEEAPDAGDVEQKPGAGPDADGMGRD